MGLNFKECEKFEKQEWIKILTNKKKGRKDGTYVCECERCGKWYIDSHEWLVKKFIEVHKNCTSIMLMERYLKSNSYGPYRHMENPVETEDKKKGEER